ncbi:MAG: hypothetical protein WA261_21065 [Candidatus Sulfotelmatobacter sp.]
MANKQSFGNSICGAETHGAERELSAFTGAVTELFGTEQARVSTEDWLEELTLLDMPSRSKERNWRAVTIAAAARLAKRLDTATHGQIYSSTSTDTKVSLTPSSNCSGSTLLLGVFIASNATPCTQQKLF